jgi:hypothetical protein
MLKATFLLGAAVDAGALAPMLNPGLAKLLWGFDRSDGQYGFAMRMGAALMAGWTLLLLWAALKPVERRAIAPMTLVVIAGIAGAEAAAVASGDIEFSKALPSWLIQAALTVLFLAGYAKAGAATDPASIQ